MHGPAFIPFGRGRPCILSAPASSGGPPRGDGPPSLACRACGPSGWFGAPPVGARGRRSSPGPLLLSQPSRGPGWPPACAAAHSGLRGASAAALAFLKPRAPASRASPFFPFGALPARGVSACARGVKVGGGACGHRPHHQRQPPLLPCWEPHYSTPSRVCARRSRPATHPAGGPYTQAPRLFSCCRAPPSRAFILRGPGP